MEGCRVHMCRGTSVCQVENGVLHVSVLHVSVLHISVLHASVLHVSAG